MGYDRGDSFLTKKKFQLVQKLSPRSYPIHCERKWNYSFLSVYCSGCIPQNIIRQENEKNERVGKFYCTVVDIFHRILFDKKIRKMSELVRTIVP